MKEITGEQIEFMIRTLQNYYFLKDERQRFRNEARTLEIKIDMEREAAGISYDSTSSIYNNTDTPYICSLIHEQASYELEAIHYEWAAKDLDKYNKIEKMCIRDRPSSALL